jgi:hypothetical protein
MRVPVLGAAVLPSISDRYTIRPAQPPQRPALSGAPGRASDGRGDPAGRSAGR